MKKKFNRTIFLFFLFCLPLSLLAQSYEQLWQQAQVLRQKQLPQSLKDKLQEIYRRAEQEKNISQMVKACLMRASTTIDITPDSLPIELTRLKTFAAQEKEPVYKALLNSLIGCYILDTGKRDEEGVEAAISYFRLSLQNPEVLAEKKAEDYRPLTVSKELSEKFCGDNMYQLLARQAISRLNGYFIPDPFLAEKIQLEVLSIYDNLIAFYKERGMKDAQLLVMLDKLYFKGNKVGSGGVNENLRLTKEQVISTLKQWAVEFAGSPLCGEVYNQLAARYDEMNDPVTKLTMARAGLEKYPQSPSAHDLKEQIAEVLTPRLQMDIRFAYPGKDSELSVKYRNLEGFTLELYRMNVPVTSGLLEGELNSSLIAQYGKLTDRTHYEVAPTPDYKETDTLFRYKFPVEGVYILKAIPDGYPKYTAFQKVNLSALQAVIVGLPGGKKEINVVDKRTGHPVPGTEVAFYRVMPGGGYKQICAYETDRNGSVTVLLPPVENWLGMNIRRPGADYMEIKYVSFASASPEAKVPNEGEKQSSVLFTDRVLYRPGQPVQVSGFIYKQSGDSVHIVPDSPVELILRDAGGQELGKLNLTTDPFGTFYGNFILPEKVLPGEFEIAVKDGESRYIRVDEYKRPTFDVVISPYSSAYRLGDSLRLKGKAETFAGVSVGACPLTYRVTRSQTGFRKIPGREIVLATGKIKTEPDGSFQIPVFLQAPDRDEPGNPERNYTYKVTAEVTGLNGETESGSFILSVGSASLSLSIQGLHAKMAKEKLDSIRIKAVNFSGQPLRMPVTCVIYRLEGEGRKGPEVWKNIMESFQPFSPEEMHSVLPGRYRMEVTAMDSLGRICAAEQDFILFSLSDRRLPVFTSEWFYQDGKEFDAQQPVDLYVGTSEKDIYMFYDVFCDEKRIESERFILSDEIRRFRYWYKPEYGEGIIVNFAFMFSGKLYRKQVKIARPRPDKNLQLRWKTFRDKLQPGGKESWQLQVLFPDSRPADARVLATLYDASLDKLYVNNWDFRLNFPRFIPHIRTDLVAFNHSIWLYSYFPYSGSSLHSLSWWNGYSYLDIPSWRVETTGNLFRGKTKSRLKKTTGREKAEEDESAEDEKGFETDDGVAVIEVEESGLIEWEEDAYVPVRKDFAETAFFYPALRTDSAGVVSMEFILPESLTEWKFMGMAFTRNMEYGRIKAHAKTVKPFMVQLNMPRFIRTGDEVSIVATIANLSERPVEGIARMELVDPRTDRIVGVQKMGFGIKVHRTDTVSFQMEAPDLFHACICRVIAEGEHFSDGEQRYLPILSDKQLLTESISVQLKEEEHTSISVDELFNKGSKTAGDKQLTVELTAYPDWWVMRALPVIGAPLYEDALSFAVAYYANSLSKEILRKNPRMGQLFENWLKQNSGDDTFSSPFVLKQDVKNVGAQEMPWVLAAMEEEARNKNSVFLFDRNTLDSKNRIFLSRLEELQLPDGSWSWYRGMPGNRAVTIRIVELLARLQAMNIPPGPVKSMYDKGIKYLSGHWMKTYESILQEEKKGRKIRRLDDFSLHFLYVCALDKQTALRMDKKAYAYMLGKLKNDFSGYTVYEKAHIALIWDAAGNQVKAEEAVRSIFEYSVATPEMGRYFDTPKAPYSDAGSRIPTQVAAIEAFSRITCDTVTIDEMKQWLLKQKQVQSWRTPVVTADAIYAFFCKGAERPVEPGSLKAEIGDKELITSGKGNGYIRQTFSETSGIIPTVEIEHSGGGTGWAAIYATYREEMDKISSTKGNGLKISRTYYRAGKEVSSKTALEVGDELTILLTVKADRDMDFVQIQDTRAACMEPGSEISGYEPTPELSYYKVIRDTCTEFFIDKLGKGTWRISYKVRVDRKGIYQTGMARAQSVYAPELVGYAKGIRLIVH